MASRWRILCFQIDERDRLRILRLQSEDGTNRLTRQCVLSLTDAVCRLSQERVPLIITGNGRFFSAGADLEEISVLDGPSAYEFSKMGQELMRAVEEFPAPVYAAVSGYCMGGGLDLALACHHRIASPHAVFGHRGAALGLMTGWGGTQRLPRLVGKGTRSRNVRGGGEDHGSGCSPHWIGGRDCGWIPWLRL